MDAYSLSKLAAENYVQLNSAGTYCAQIGVLPHVFGPGARPFYNSVIATWCHQLANGLPARVTDGEETLSYELIHVDHVVSNAIEAMDSALNATAEFMEQQQKSDGARWYVPYATEVCGYVYLSTLYSFLKQCAEVRAGGPMPSQGLRWERDLYATFLSYVGDCEYMYAPKTIDDQRGKLVQILGGDGLGQWYTAEFAPGAVRGNHYHKRKAEKFFVVHGCVDIELKGILEPYYYRKFTCMGEMPRIVDVPPNYVHTLTNTTSRTATVLCWTQELFDENDQDTYREKTDAI